MHFNNIGRICTDSLRHGNGLSAMLLFTRAAKSSAAKISTEKTRSKESGLTSQQLFAPRTKHNLFNIVISLLLLTVGMVFGDL